MNGGGIEIKQFQFNVVCHACGTANTIVLCSNCGRLNDIVYKHCCNCGLKLENPDVGIAPACVEIFFDFDNRPLVSEGGHVWDYLAAMVRQVKERAGQMGLGSLARFVFKMSPELWEDISDLYASALDSVTGTMLVEALVWEKRAELRPKQSIFVDGVEYPVELDGSCNDDIFFMPDPELPGPRRLLTAVLQKVGSSDENG